tara:strand:- start:328 stop:666 length:339 start_codon:yes stop_codon:yes gene_type:complete
MTLSNSQLLGIVYNLESFSLDARESYSVLYIHKQINNENTGIYGEIWLDGKLSVDLKISEYDDDLTNDEIFEIWINPHVEDFLTLTIDEVPVTLSEDQQELIIKDIVLYGTR